MDTQQGWRVGRRSGDRRPIGRLVDAYDLAGGEPDRGGERLVELEFCRVYWGSHGCDRPRGHRGPHVCDDCYDPADTEGYVGSWPYYGPETRFYGEDVADWEPRVSRDAADRMGRADG